MRKRNKFILGRPRPTAGSLDFMQELRAAGHVALGAYVEIHGKWLFVRYGGREDMLLDSIIDWAKGYGDKPIIAAYINHSVGDENANACVDNAIDAFKKAGIRPQQFVIVSADLDVLRHIRKTYENMRIALLLKGKVKKIIGSLPLAYWNELKFEHLVIKPDKDERLEGEGLIDELADLAGYAQLRNIQVWIFTGTLISFAAALVERKVGIISECPEDVVPDV